MRILSSVDANVRVHGDPRQGWRPDVGIATYNDELMLESSIEVLGHTVGGIAYRHYAHRAPLAGDHDAAAASSAFATREML